MIPAVAFSFPNMVEPLSKLIESKRDWKESGMDTFFIGFRCAISLEAAQKSIYEIDSESLSLKKDFQNKSTLLFSNLEEVKRNIKLDKTSLDDMYLFWLDIYKKDALINYSSHIKKFEGLIGEDIETCLAIYPFYEKLPYIVASR